MALFERLLILISWMNAVATLTAWQKKAVSTCSLYKSAVLGAL